MSGLEFFMVELVGVEPMTYTMRTYRSSQLSYSPKSKLMLIFLQHTHNIARKITKNKLR